MKNIENKIGKADDPLFEHPYFQIKIKAKQDEFEKNRPKIFKAHCEPDVKSTATGSTHLNKSTAHFEERGEELNLLKRPTSTDLKFENFKNSRDGTNFKSLPVPVRNFKRQTAIGFSPFSDWKKRSSQDIQDFPNDPTRFLPQDVCDANFVSQDLCPYSDDELESARSLRTLKSGNLR